MIPQGERAILEALIIEYVSLSKGMRFAEKRGFWDAEESRPVLAPEESERRLVGWNEIERYWSATKGSLTDLQSECWGIVIQPVSPEVAIVLFNLAWTAQVASLGPGAPLGAHVRVTSALRRKTDGWRIFSYVEGHIDAVEYMRSYYRSQSLAWASGPGASR